MPTRFERRHRRDWQAWALAGAAILPLASITIAGCGKFGNRQDPSLTVTYAPASVGCLNDIGPKLTQYLAGTVDPNGWGATVDCAASSVDQFRQFVQPSSSQGYTSQDLSAFLGKFLLTQFPDNADIVSALLKIKALVLGGSPDDISFDDLDRAKSLLGTLRAESLRLLPLIAARAQSPSPAALLQLADGLAASGANIAAALPMAMTGASGARDLSWDDAAQVAAAAARVLGWTEPAQLIPVATAAKAIIFAGWTGGLEAALVPTLVQTGATLGGLEMAAVSLPAGGATGPNATADFYVRLAERARPTLNALLARHGGALALPNIDALLDALPASTLPAPASLFEQALRPFVNTMLRSSTASALDASDVNLLYQLAEQWDTSEIYLETIFDRMGETVDAPPADFVAAATSYASGLGQAAQPLITRLTTLAGMQPFFEGDDNQITFTAQDRVSLGQLQKLLLIRMGAEQLLLSYSSAAGHATFSVSDLQHVIDDYKDLSLALHFLDATLPSTAASRFQEADLFTMASDGNGALNIDEGTYYLADFLSGENTAAQIRGLTETACGNGTFDSLGWQWMDADCFRDKFYGGYLDLWNHFPHLTDFYSSLSDADRASFQQVMEASSRYYGYTQAPWASYDVGAIIGLMQYMETLFMRFDTNQDGMLDLSESLVAYPVFKLTLAQVANQPTAGDSRLQAILTYILRFAQPPATNFLGIAKFIWWEAWRPFWQITANRMTVYSVMADLTTPVSLPPVPNPNGQPTPTPTPSANAAVSKAPLEMHRRE